MIVMTIDQRKSRTNPDKVESLLQWLSRSYRVMRGFERTAGDEVQGVLGDGVTAARIALAVAATGDWSVGIGIGAVESPLPEQTRAGRGLAFENARDAVDRAKKSGGAIAVSGPGNEAGRIEAELQLISILESRRSESSAEAGRLVVEGMTQYEIAVKLGISQQAVSQRLASGLWHETEKLATYAAQALEEYSRIVEGNK
ncbi:hypothetical protein CQ018_08970 [Arthrobacter sp. MYb227]|uniref:hypothetical protein n=1 Tax=Arthrobacter sp. MYb227 TaxID=1848601 RepID=UPI000CFB2372|nr:hypothetical protein [Arthrobacter sp. MYb227]PQZ93775.1 hypothetical protein CQ018_08970 [Arthrobacter sp. MYb227]